MSTYTTDQLRKAFDQVQGHVAELHGRWALFRKLYRGNADSVPVLSEVGGEMFWLLGRLLHRGSFLLFRQLIDPPVTMGKRNASFEGLVEALAGSAYKTDHPDLMKQIDDLRSKKVLKEHVDKYIAHLDFDLLAGAVDPPKAVEILDFEDALRIMREFIAETGSRFVPGRTYVDCDAARDLITEQAVDTVEVLRKGLAERSLDSAS